MIFFRRPIILLMLLALLVPSVSVLSAVRIRGLVVDEHDRPITFAVVNVEGQAAFAMSGNDGKYSLTCESRDSLTLICSLLGYRTRKFKVYNPQDSVVMNLKIVSKSTTLGEVNVSALKRQTDMPQSINQRNTKFMPSTTGNAVEELVATQMGVTSRNELSSQYNVRGGSYDENCVYLNGVEVYRPLLIRSGEQEGLSIINSNMVKDINFSAGGFPAKYGDKMSSVLDITYKRPEKFEASLAGSLMGGDAYVGFGNKKFSMMNGLRYKTTRTLLGSSDTNGEYDPNFLDFQNYTSWRPSEKWTIDFIGNISNNHYNFEPSDRETKFGTQEHAMSFKVYFDGKEKDLFRTYFGALNLQHNFTKKTSLSWLSSAYTTKEQETYDIQGQYWLNETTSQTQLGVGTYLEHARNFLNARVLQTQLVLRSMFGSHNFQAAVSMRSENVKENAVEWEKRDSSGYNVPSSAGRLTLVYNLRAKTEVKSNRYEGYVQDTYKFSGAAGLFTLNAGVRVSSWDWNDELLVSPRASLALIPRFNENFTFRFATGVYYQAPFYKELRDTVTANGNTTVLLNKDIKSQRSIHFVLGGDYQFRALGRPFRFSTELYYKNLHNLIPYNVNNMRIVYYGKNMCDGYAAGIDFKIFGEFVPGTDSWLTFGLMSAKQKWDGKYSSLPSDQRYNVSLFFSDFFPNATRWKMSLKGALAGGLPFGAPHAGIQYSSFRAPAYKRVDVGLSYRVFDGTQNGKKRSAIKDAWLGVDAFNVLGINNVNSYYWVTDVNNNQYAVPNYLTGRVLNVRFLLDF